jgi:16S rRNA (cytosine967-C5)-methyltransferase
MTPAARVQAAIEILDAVIEAAREGGAAADTVIARYFQTRRYAGSKDRRAVRELVYEAVRVLGEVPKSGRAAMIGHARANRPELLDLFDGGPNAPNPVTEGDLAATPVPVPGWLMPSLHRRFGGSEREEIAALLARAPLDLRVNTLKATRDAVLAEMEGLQPIPALPDGLRADAAFNVEATAAYREGRVEVQDAGSQRVCLAAAAKPGMTVVDLCAGAGGKTLALAAAMANMGRLIACDTDRGRLSRLLPRAERAGVSIAETRLLNPNKEAAALADLAGKADLVLVDAPCSGTGTWRRNPEARWRLTPERLARVTALQAHILNLAVPLLRPGGRLVYVVCSLLPEEGEARTKSLLARHPALKSVTYLLPGRRVADGQSVLTPRTDDTDGFFIAVSELV